VLNFHQPIAVVLAMTLHFFDPGTARAITQRLAAGIPPGSYLIVSVGQLDGEIGQQFTAEYGAGHLHHHTRADVAASWPTWSSSSPGSSMHVPGVLPWC